MKITNNAWMLFFSLVLISPLSAMEHQHQKQASSTNTATEKCVTSDIRCAQTVTTAFAPNGDLWRLWSHQQALYFDISKDNGAEFSMPHKVAISAEPISSRNENRPKLAFDSKQGVYLSWASPRQKKHTADVRFSYSKDYGQTFTAAVTVNNDNLLTGHSFNEMLVSANGEISIVWLDGRLKQLLRKEGKKTNGSALFLAKANFYNGNTEFSNQMLANETCVCCRIAVDYNQQGNMTILWRHIYGDNIREFALLTVNEQQKPIQVSYDHWQINGCPHQGGAVSVDQDNRYHLVWFNQGDKGKGIFYAYSDDSGQNLSTPLSVGKLSARAAHPHLMSTDTAIDIVWLEFTGTEHQLWHQRSVDKGLTFSTAKKIASATDGADRPFIVRKDGVNYVSWQRPKQSHWLMRL